MNWVSGLSVNDWYAYPAENWGVLKDRKGEAAFDVVAEWMTGAFRLWGPVRVGNRYEMAFGRDTPSGYKAVVAWDIGTNSYNGSSSYTIPAGMNYYRDLDGGSTACTPGNSVTIGQKPLWFETHDLS